MQRALHRMLLPFVKIENWITLVSLPPTVSTMSTVTTVFTPIPGVTVTVSVISDGDSVTTRIFTSTGSETHTNTFSYPISLQDENLDEYDEYDYELASTSSISD